ncbi:MAG TPA: DUF4384 domain-containing protein [Pyrinomonadaceae bacterium]
MRLRNFFLLFLCAFVAMTITPARPQNDQDGQQVIDDFRRTRGIDFSSPEKSGKPKKGKTATGKSAKSSAKKPVTTPENRPDNVNKPPDSEAEPSAETVGAPSSPFRIGLGYTILRYGAGDELAAVTPDTVFKTGDQLLLALETNADGYLYIFNAENDGNPEMLYPNVILDSGRNNISAHTRERYPTDPEQRFTIEGEPATERLYIIFSRKPLLNVPTGEALVKLCDSNCDNYYWSPKPAQWEKINSLATATQVIEGRSGELAKVESPVRSDLLTRSIKIRPKAPVPAVVRMSASTTADILMTTIDLTHN